MQSRGFTLLEVMVALAIVAFALVGLLGLHNRNLGMVGRDQDLTLATLAAQRLIAEMEVIDQGFPELGVTSGELAGLPGFRWERQVEPVGDELEDLRQVDLRVIWDERTPDACHLRYYIRDHRPPEER